MLLLVKPAVGLASWIAYTSIQQNRIEKSTFAKMRILSEMRQAPYGNSTNIPALVEKLPTNKKVAVLSSLFGNGNKNKKDNKKQGEDDDDIVRKRIVDDAWMVMASYNAGGNHVDDNVDVNDIILSQEDSVFRSTGNDFACCYTDNGQCTAILSKEPVPNASLRDLVKTRTTEMEIIEDIPTRINWNRQINACTPVVTTATSSDQLNLCGDYSFCYREYVNHEELLGMVAKRWGITRLLFQSDGASRLVIGSDAASSSSSSSSSSSVVKSTLRERGLLFGFVPVEITWEGHLAQGDEGNEGEVADSSNKDQMKIVWDTTDMVMGWRNTRFGKVIDRPPAAEVLRKDNWYLKVPFEQQGQQQQDDGTTDILCIRRENKGHLVYAKEECLRTVPKGPIRRLFGLFRRNKSSTSSVTTASAAEATSENEEGGKTTTTPRESVLA